MPSKVLHIHGRRQLDQAAISQFVFNQSCRQKSCTLASKDRL